MPRLIPLLLSLAVAAPLHAAPAAAPASPPLRTASAPTLLQRLRQLIGYNPSQAVGGSRSGSYEPLWNREQTSQYRTGAEERSTAGASGSSAARPDRVCVVNPPLQRQRDGRLLAVVASAEPVIVTAEPLLELRIERGGTIAWQQRASSSEPIRGPIAWPLQPLVPGEEVRLRLRPRGASGSDFADIQLKAAPAAMQQQAAALLQRSDRLAQIEALLGQRQGALASELVFAPLPTGQPLPPELAQLRREMIDQGCSTSRR